MSRIKKQKRINYKNNKMTTRPIGIFDSGIGGTSIWQELKQLLPNENTIYLSDSKNAPYGEKSRDKIIDLSVKNTDLLLDKGCKIIVVACNTATTNAITFLREQYNIPFIGIEPAIKPASLITKTKTIGILATKGTLNSELFEITSSKIDSQIRIIEQVGKGLVELIESGNIKSTETQKLLNQYIEPMLLKGIDSLVLGCTHYPYLIPEIQKITKNKIKIIDSGAAVAKQTKNILLQNDLLNLNTKKGYNHFYINKDKTVLTNILCKHQGVKIEEMDF